ncbi:MAG: twin-arginine translocase subunit TatC [Rhodothalassiaceae bacterium]
MPESPEIQVKRREEEARIRATTAPIIEHLVELRKRLSIVLVVLAVAFLLCWSVSDLLYDFLTRPLARAFGDQEGRRMIFTALHEAFFTRVKVAFFGALCIALPVGAVQLWKFVAPGLYDDERQAFWPFLVATPILFLTGAALVYFGIIPLAWEFFLGFEQPGGDGSLAVQLEARVSEYLDLVTRLILAFGCAFQLPVLLVLMARAGLIDADSLVKGRKYAVLAVFALAAVITPPDIVSQIGLGGAMLLLYEAAILVIRRTARRARGDTEDAKAV